MYLIRSLSRDQIIHKFWDQVEKDFDLRRFRKRMQIVDVEGFYIPVWVSSVAVEGVCEYLEIEDRRVVRRSERIAYETPIGFCARRAVAAFAVTDVIYHFLKTFDEKLFVRLIDLSPEEWERTKLKVLNTEIDVSEVKDRMLEDAIDLARHKHGTKTVVFFYARSMFMQEPRLYFLPLWIIYYRVGSGVYRMALAGWDGCRVAASEPVLLLRRAVYVAGVSGAIVAASFLGSFLHLQVAIFGALLFILFSLAYILGRATVGGARIEHLYRKEVPTARGTVAW